MAQEASKTKSGYEDVPQFGGPGSVVSDLKEDDEVRDPYPEGKLGVIEEGAFADIILFDGNPLKSLKILEDFERMKLVMKDGKIYKNEL